jgi:hypothetical protein
LSPAEFAAFLLAGAGGSDVVGVALCAFAAAAAVAAASAAAAVAAALAVGADPVAVACADAAAADRIAVAGAVPGAAVVPAGFALLLPETSDCAAVVASAVAAALACAAASAWAVAAVSFIPRVATAFAFAVPLALAPVSTLLFATAPLSAAVSELTGFGAFGAGLERESELPVFPVELLVGVDVCCAVCGGLAGWVGAAGGGLGGADVVASSKAANGGEAVSWLGVDACIREGEVSETAAGRSGAILDILDTR